MASIPVKVSDEDTDIEQVYTFDHLGREIPLGGYEGGVQYLSSDELSAASIRSVILGTRLTENVNPQPSPNQEGDFGHRTGRGARRVMASG